MVRIQKIFMIDLDVEKSLKLYTEKIQCSQGLMINCSIREFLKNHCDELKKYFVNHKTLIEEIKMARNKIEIEEFIEKNKDIIRSATLFKETLTRLKILKDNGMLKIGIADLIKNEIDILKRYDVRNSVKRHYCKYFKKTLIGLNKQKTKEDYLKFLDELIETFNRMMNYTNIPTNRDECSFADKDGNFHYFERKK